MTAKMDRHSKYLTVLTRPLFLGLLLMMTLTIMTTFTLQEAHFLTEADFSISSINIVGELPKKTLLLEITVVVNDLRTVLDVTILDFRYELYMNRSEGSLGVGRLTDPISFQQTSVLTLHSAFRVYNVSRFVSFLVNQATTTALRIEGDLFYKLLGFTASMHLSFTHYPSSQNNDFSFLEELRLVQFHPVPPGTNFSLSVGLVSKLPLNVTLLDATFVVKDNLNEGATLGNAFLDDKTFLSVGLNVFNFTLQAQNDVIEQFVQSFMTEGIINATMDELFLKMHVLEEDVAVTTSYTLFLNTSGNVPQSFESVRFNLVNQSFDLTYRFESSIFWGFNISSLSFDIYHHFSGEENASLIGSGQLIDTVFVEYNESVLVPIRVRIPVQWWGSLLGEYLDQRSLFIDIKNGNTRITAYSELNVTVHFEQLDVRVI